MTSIRSIIIGAGLFVSLNLLHAQTTMVGSFNRIGTPIQTAPPDSIVAVTAESQGLSLVAPEDLPFGGTFWEVMPGGIMAPLPCPPVDQTLPIYAITDTAFLVDATGGQVTVNTRQLKTMSPTQTATSDVVASVLDTQATAIVDLINQVQTASANQQVRTMAMAMGVPSPGGDTGTSTNSYSPNGAQMSPPDYGTNFWIAQWKLSNHAVTGFVSNTIASIPYEIQTNTDLASTNWGSTGLFIYGSETTNWTALSFMSASLTNNCFFRLRSWASSDGSGLPDWWQEQYFGVASGVDPYGNPAGDGYSNLQKFQNGMNPNQFYTPAAPQGVTANLNQSAQTASLSWLPASGNVTGYTVEKNTHSTWYGSDTVQTFTVSATATSYLDDISGNSPDPWAGDAYNVTFRVRALYSSNNSGWSPKVPLQPATVSGFIIPGPNGETYLEVAGIPANAAFIRLKMVFSYSTAYDFFYTNVMHDIPVTSINNDRFVIPASWQISPVQIANGIWQTYIYVATLRSVDASGTTSAENYVGGIGSVWGTPFYDGRAQMKQNLIFQLRAAPGDDGFQFRLQGTNMDDQGTFGAYTGTYVYPTNYACAGLFLFANTFHSDAVFGNFDPYLPFVENCLFRNFIYNLADVDVNGNLTTGVDNQSYYDSIELSRWPTYQFQTNGMALPNLLSANDSRWLYYDQSPFNGGDSWMNILTATGINPDLDQGTLSMPANIRNWFGLPYLSAKLAYYHYGDGGTGSGLTTTVLSAGTTLSLPGDDIYSLADNAYSDIYLETAQPQFQTVKYCFYRTDYNWLPGSAQFTPTNDSPMLMKQYPGTATWYATNDLPFLIVPAGGWTQLAGYAKLAVLNGYPDVYAYLGQYFDQAYKVDANGNVTTNITGIVSPYGNYFATDAGVAALVTMPDLDTPYQRGTCTVYSVSLQFDKNHDGIMDSAWNGPDATSQASPMVAWVNSGHTEPGSNGGLDIDKAVPPATTNYLAQQITCQRDLENFFRLWICGVPTLAFSNGYSATITCTAITGTPAINIYLAETNGGTLYLTDTNVAQSLVNEFAMGTAGTGSGQTCILPNDFFDGKNKYLLFEGAGIGEGQFTLTIYQGTTAIAQTSTFIDLHDVKDLYEQAHIANVATTYPAMVNSTNASIFVVDHPSPMNSVGTNQMIVFVHGWRMTQFNYYSFSESMFKRLYWAGYQGRFAALKWPTLSADTSGDISQYFTYNRSEHIAFDSGVGASAYFDSLKARFPDYSINVAAHSMGNIVMMETLKNQLAAGHTAIDNYVLMQAAAPAHCYQSSLPDYGRFTTAEANHHTPDVYRGYPGAINGALNGKMVNFFNTNDYALATGVYLGVQANWEKNQVDNKPDSYWSYTTDGTNADCYYGNHRVITNPRELMPFVARPRSQAIGARAGVAGVIQGGEVDLTGQFNFFGGSDEHSAQFNWNIQKLDPFYRKLLTTFFPPQ